jgi:5-methylcytosine-specific restriction endonuclease McrA
MTDPALTTRARRRLTAHLKATRPPVCWLCNQPIDMSLPWPNPQCCVVDERIPRSYDGSAVDPTNCELAHNLCNQRRGNRPPQHVPSTSARAW